MVFKVLAVVSSGVKIVHFSYEKLLVTDEACDKLQVPRFGVFTCVRAIIGPCRP